MTVGDLRLRMWSSKIMIVEVETFDKYVEMDLSFESLKSRAIYYGESTKAESYDDFIIASYGIIGNCLVIEV